MKGRKEIMMIIRTLLIFVIALVSAILNPLHKEWIIVTPEATYKVRVSDDSKLIPPPESMADHSWLIIPTGFTNETYIVKLSDGVCVKDMNGNTLKVFDDFDYSIFGCFQPGSNNFAVKLKSGGFAVYDLDTLSLLNVVEQEGMDHRGVGIAFSTDGEYLYDIEHPVYIYDTNIDVYRTSDYQKIKTIELEKQGLFAYFLDFVEDGTGYVFGATIEEDGCGMIGILEEDKITEIRYFSDDVMVFLLQTLVRKYSGSEVLFAEESNVENSNDFQSCSMEIIYNLFE